MRKGPLKGICKLQALLKIIGKLQTHAYNFVSTIYVKENPCLINAAFAQPVNYIFFLLYFKLHAHIHSILN